MDLREDEPTQAMGPPPSGRRPTGTHGPRTIGAWLIERELGRGNYGVVYLARRPDNPRPAALKVLRVTELDDEGRARFEREARVGKSFLGDPGVAGVIEIGQHHDRPWYAMEYVPGPTLQAVLKERGQLEPSRAAELVGKLARTLARAHARGIIHRDLKPGNVILEEPGGRPRITDLGLAKELGVSTLTATGEIMGTPAYMAPEQLDDTKRTDAQADVWALGVILYECLTGRRPYQAKTITAQVQLLHKGGAEPPGVDPALDAVCLRALAYVPPERPSASELADLLEGWRAGGTPPTVGSRRRPAPPTERAVTTEIPRPQRALIVAGGVLIAGLLAATAVGLSRSGSRVERPGPGVTTSSQPAPSARSAAAAMRVEQALRAARAALEGEATPGWEASMASAEAEAKGDPELERQVAEAARGDRATLMAGLTKAGPHQAWLERTAEAAIGRCDGEERDRLRLGLARWLATRGRFDRATKLLLGLVGAPGELGDRAVLWLTWTWCLEGIGPHIAQVDELLRSRRESALVLAARAVLHCYVGQVEEAAAIIQGALARASNDPELSLARAWIQLRRERRPLTDESPLASLAGDPRASMVLATSALGSRDNRRAHELLHAALEQLEGRGREAAANLSLLSRLCGVVEGCQGPSELLLSSAEESGADAIVALIRLDRRRQEGDQEAARAQLVRLFDQVDRMCRGRELLSPSEPLGKWATLVLAGSSRLLAAWPTEEQVADDLLASRAAQAGESAREPLKSALRLAARGATAQEVARALAPLRSQGETDPVVALEVARLSCGRDLPGSDEAIARARRLNPDRAGELDLLAALALLRAGSISQAREALERLAASQPPNAAGACARGELALLAGDWRTAGAEAEQALRLERELLPATTTLAQALLHLDPPGAEELVAIGITRWGYSDARLVGVGVEQGLRAQTFAIAVQNVFAVDEFLTSQARADLLHRLTAAVWSREVHARHLLLVAPYCFGGFFHAQYRTWAEEQLQLGRRERPDDASLELAAGLQSISVHLREGQPVAPPEPCLAAWSKGLQREPGLLLPVEHAERFADLYPDHPLLSAWRERPEPRPPLARFLSEALRGR